MGIQITDILEKRLFMPYPYCFTDAGAGGRVFIRLDPATQTITKVLNGIKVKDYHQQLEELLDQNKSRNSMGDGGRADEDEDARMPETEIDGGLPDFDPQILDGLLDGIAPPRSES